MRHAEIEAPAPHRDDALRSVETHKFIEAQKSVEGPKSVEAHKPIAIAPEPPPLADLCANVQSSFDRLAIFAEQHDLSYSVAAFYVLVGSLNILPLEGGRMIFQPVSPARIAKVAHMEPKTVSRWCTQLAERGLLLRKRGAYSVERLADWYVLAGCMQTVRLPPLPGLTPEPIAMGHDVLGEAMAAFSGEPGAGAENSAP